MYLDGIAVSAANGTPLFTVQFGYEPSPPGPNQAVANVTSFTGALQYATFKRYLTSVMMVNATGAASPGYLFDYHLTPAADAQLGALRSVTVPQGGGVTYA